MRFLLFILLSLSVSACSSARIGARETAAAGGAVIGAGLGAIVGNQSGNAGPGVAIGAAVGALTGGLIGSELDRLESRAAERDLRIQDQDRRIRENSELLRRLRDGGADAEETERGVVVNIPDVLFEFDSALLTAEAKATIQRIAEVLSDSDRSRSLAVEGHTDAVGGLEYNLQLSEKRAVTVADELVHRGVSRGRMSVQGFGESRPIATNVTDSGRSRNRRVEIVLENSVFILGQ